MGGTFRKNFPRKLFGPKHYAWLGLNSRKWRKLLKYGFHNKSFILNAPLVSFPIPSSSLGGFAAAKTTKQ
jgi:hypothetical protein